MSLVSPLSRRRLRRPLLLVLSVVAALSSPAFAGISGPPIQFVPSITTIAGTGTNGYSGDAGQATAAQFNIPRAAAIDAAGNVYIADMWNNRIRKIDTSGVVTTIAGTGTNGFGGDGGDAKNAQLNWPSDIAIDASGNLYVADMVNNRVRKIDTNGIITTVAGSSAGGFGGDNGAATAAKLNSPGGIDVDAAGNIYIADSYNYRIRKVDAASGVITTIAGTGVRGFNGDGLVATAAQLFTPTDVAVDGSGKVYIVDFGNSRIRLLSGGIVTTVAGTSTNGFSGDGGAATSAQLNSPGGVAVDAAGNLYISDAGNARVRKVTNGIINTFAGTGTMGFAGDGGPAFAALMGGTSHLSLDSKGNLYIADPDNGAVRKVSAGASTASVPATSLGQSINASVAVMVNRDLTFKSITLGGSYATQQGSEFKITSAVGCPADGFQGVARGTICQFNVTFNPTAPGHRTASLVFVGTDNQQYTLALAGEATGPQVVYSPTFPNPTTMTLSTGLNNPTALTFDNAGNGYIADQGRVQEVVNLGQLVNLNTQVNFATPSPTGLATDAQGNLYISDATTSYVTKVTPLRTALLNGQYVFGNASQISVEADGKSLSSASGIAATDRGDLYIADKGNSRVVKVTAEGIATALNTGTITLDSPEGVAVDSKGNVFIADVDHIVKVAANGSASLVSTGSLTLGHAKGVAVDPVGNLYIADSTNKKLIRITTDGTATIVQTTGISFDPVRGPVIVNSTDNVDSITTNGIYLATSDAEANTVTVAIMAMAAPLTFSDTQVGHDSPDGTKTITLQNVGNASLTFSTPSSGSNPIYPDSFPVDDNASQLCTAGTVLNSGSFCNVAPKFHPTQAGPQSGTIMLAADMTGTMLPLMPISVSGKALPGLDHFSVTGAPATADAGTAFNVTVSAQDGSTPSNVVTDYTGTVHLKSSDALAGLPEDYTFTPADNGAHTFSVTLKTAGSQFITVYDKNNFQVKGEAPVQVNAGTPATITVVSGDGQSAIVGSYIGELEVKVLDQYSNPIPNAAVNFTVPASGAGVTVNSGTRTTQSDGTAYFYAVANGVAGTYQIAASVQGVDTPAVFHLTNTAGTTTTSLTATPSSGATYGQAVTLAATVTPKGYIPPAISRSPAQPRTPVTAPIGPATGMVSFYDGTKLVGTATLGGDAVVVGSSRSGLQAHYSEQSAGVAATATLNIAAPLAGDHSYTAVYAGDPNFTTSQTTAAVAVTIGQTAATLTGPANQPVQVGQGQTGTVAVTVAAQSGTGLAAPTGTVTYTVGSGSPIQVQLTNGQATLQVPSTLAIGNYSIQATYSGDSNYLPTTTATTIQVSVVNTVPPDFSLTANPTSLTIKAGETGHATFTLTPVGGFTGTVTFSCGDLPAGVTCTFAPASLTADGSNTPLTSQLTITTQRLVGANLYLPGALLGILLFWQRRRFNLRTAQVLMLIVGAAVIAGMVGCGSSPTPTPQSNASTTSVTVTAKATAGSGGTAAHTATFNLNITD